MGGPRTAEDERLLRDKERAENWKRWGTYLPERQWGTVREDYSADGEVWRYFSHEDARSRVYRWGEDGLLGLCDRQGRLCFALALWNERDRILKERLFGLANHEGNHGEDVKELYFYLDATPTCSYARALYKYPQRAFPYEALLEAGRTRSRAEPELEIEDTGAFDEGRYFDVHVTYAKASPDDVHVLVEIENRGPETATLHVLPQLWFRNTWAWGRTGESYWHKPSIEAHGSHALVARHATLPTMVLAFDEGLSPELLFTDNETNTERLFGTPNRHAAVKDAFHEHVVQRRPGVLRSDGRGTKAAGHCRFRLAPGETARLRLRLTNLSPAEASDFRAFDALVARRKEEADAFYAAHLPKVATADERHVARQAYAGLLWSKQFYHLIAEHWLEGDPDQPPPPAGRPSHKHRDWRHLYNRDVLSVPDKWEYPWFAAWDLAFHMLPLARIDAPFAKEQLILLLREWYMHPNGHIPAYEFAFSDVNPPVHAWAAYRVYKLEAARGERDRHFLARVFQKLLLNFTWWVNRKDEEGNNLFAGGFLGLDNIGIFDRSKPLPRGYRLRQSDGTAWMAFYAATMLDIALELAAEDPTYEDVASKFFEHFIAIVDAMNAFGGTGLWNDEDGFYYDQLHRGGETLTVRARSIVGIIPLFAVLVLDEDRVAKLPGFSKRLRWFLENRPDLARHISCFVPAPEHGTSHRRLLAVPSRARLLSVLRYVLDENEFLSPYGVRSLSRVHKDAPFVLDGERVEYAPGDSPSPLFGGNSNWRGPIWFPVNYLLIESLQKYHYFYGDDVRVEMPRGSGRLCTLLEVAQELGRRLSSLFLPDASGVPPSVAHRRVFREDPGFARLALFHEYFHGDDGHGLGAEHQTGWTALITRILEQLASARGDGSPSTGERAGAPR